MKKDHEIALDRYLVEPWYFVLLGDYTICAVFPFVAPYVASTDAHATLFNNGKSSLPLPGSSGNTRRHNLLLQDVPVGRSEAGAPSQRRIMVTVH